ncbi:hypothetical protein GCM10010246_69850 [Streptomyces cuspidosporus]|uniref:Uncharacterized protein n=1 Tax=Streptomyces cuspidosporus TaxID=66882 RepID=A0ABN3H1J9_9ACTN
MLRAMPRSAASEREEGSRVPGASRPLRTASRRAPMSAARTPVVPLRGRSRWRSAPRAGAGAGGVFGDRVLRGCGLGGCERAGCAEVARESSMGMDHTPGLMAT